MKFENFEEAKKIHAEIEELLYEIKRLEIAKEQANESSHKVRVVQFVDYDIPGDAYRVNRINIPASILKTIDPKEVIQFYLDTLNADLKSKMEQLEKL